MSNINGIYAASMSILNKDLTLNIDKTITHAEMVIDNGCHGVAIFGSTGQACPVLPNIATPWQPLSITISACVIVLSMFKVKSLFKIDIDAAYIPLILLINKIYIKKKYSKV